MKLTAYHWLENNQAPFLGLLPRTCLLMKIETRLQKLSFFRAAEREELGAL